MILFQAKKRSSTNSYLTKSSCWTIMMNTGQPVQSWPSNHSARLHNTHFCILPVYSAGLLNSSCLSDNSLRDSPLWTRGLLNGTQHWDPCHPMYPFIHHHIVQDIVMLKVRVSKLCQIMIDTSWATRWDIDQLPLGLLPTAKHWVKQEKEKKVYLY